MPESSGDKPKNPILTNNLAALILFNGQGRAAHLSTHPHGCQLLANLQKERKNCHGVS